MHVLAGAVGVHLDWLFLEPFGYIKPTNLVGIGLCNNPFFDDDKDKMVPWDDLDVRNGLFVSMDPMQVRDKLIVDASHTIGQVRIDVTVIDEKTLLSSVQGVPMEVLP